MKSLQAEIARRAKVSQSTVSRALRNHPALPQATCQRVQAIARQLGYEANPLLSAVLSSVRRSREERYLGTIAFLTAHTTADSWKAIATYRDFFLGAQKRAEMQGFALEAHWAAEPGLSGKRLSDIFRARGIAGVLLGGRGAEAHFPELRWNQLSVVRLGLSQLDLPFHCAVNHQIRTARLVATELATRGYRRIGLAVSAWQNEVVDHNWWAGFLVWQQTQAVDCRVAPHVPDALAAHSLLAWVKRERPDAIVAVNPEVIGWLEQGGYRVPADLGVALLDWHDTYGDVAGADQNNRLVGAAAVDAVIGQLRRNEHGIPEHPRTILIGSSWHDGATVRAKR